MSTYATRAPDVACRATSCTLPTVGMPDPRSMNWVIPARTQCSTARRGKARLSLAICGPSGISSRVLRATSPSMAKLCEPPRNQSQILATLGWSIATSPGAHTGRSVAMIASASLLTPLCAQALGPSSAADYRGRRQHRRAAVSKLRPTLPFAEWGAGSLVRYSVIAGVTVQRYGPEVRNVTVLPEFTEPPELLMT